MRACRKECCDQYWTLCSVVGLGVEDNCWAVGWPVSRTCGERRLLAVPLQVAGIRGMPMSTPSSPSPPAARRDKVRTVSIPTGAEPSSERLAPLLSTLPLELRPDMETFIRGAFQVGGGRRVLTGGCDALLARGHEACCLLALIWPASLVVAM